MRGFRLSSALTPSSAKRLRQRRTLRFRRCARWLALCPLTLARSFVLTLSDMLPLGRSLHWRCTQHGELGQMDSHRNHVMVRWVDGAGRLRAVDALINASAALEEADPRLPVRP
jgi:hypothetical protein